jgi:type II secretory pathway component GspD/PulD (secretin)
VRRLVWAVVAAALVSRVEAGSAPSAPATTVSVPASMVAPTTGTAGEWQVRLRAKALEWMGQTDLDFGFSIAYFRDPKHSGSIVGPFNDGRGLLTDPAAFATFPSQSNLDLGLRIFLDQMNARNGSLEAILEALEQQGEIKMLAEPTLVLKKGSGEATVRTGSRIPYASDQVAGVGVAEVTLFQDTGVVLQVAFLEVVQLEGTLYAMMKVTADVTSLAGYVSVSLDGQGNPRRVPQVNTRHISHTVMIRDKTTLIGGVLKEDSKFSNEQGPPILGDIPYVKRLFRNHSSARKTHEILFLMSVDLISPGSV